MNKALVIAGGVGNRFGADIPKQFVEVNGRPIILYTLETLQNSPDIDSISVVCVSGWESFVKSVAQKNHISKLERIITGGNTRFESIYNGILSYQGEVQDDDLLMIHDAVRACLDQEIIHDSIMTADKYGAALTVSPCYDTMFISEDGKSIDGIYPREKLFKGQTPETIKFGLALRSYIKAKKEGQLIDSPTSLLMKLGIKVGLSKGNQGNIKITTQDDIILFQTFLSKRG
jgi:2-C-methyl-D-erythritol 4-phosphate cytidylyltransferase